MRFLLSILLVFPAAVFAGNYSANVDVYDGTISTSELPAANRMVVVSPHQDDDILFNTPFVEASQRVMIIAQPGWPDINVLYNAMPAWYKNKLTNMAGNASSWADFNGYWKTLDRSRNNNVQLYKVRIAQKTCNGQADGLVTLPPWGNYMYWKYGTSEETTNKTHPQHHMVYDAAKEVAEDCGLDLWVPGSVYDFFDGQRLGAYNPGAGKRYVQVCLRDDGVFYDVYAGYHYYDNIYNGLTTSWTWFDPGTEAAMNSVWEHGDGTDCRWYHQIVNEGVDVTNSWWQSAENWDTWNTNQHDQSGSWYDSELP
jgi:hypothetical protein